MRPDAAALRAFLSSVSRRLAWIAAAEGAALGLALAFVLALVGWPGRDALVRSLGVGLLFAAVGVLARFMSSHRRRPPVAVLVERRAPQCRNVVVTADELLAQGDYPGEYTRTLVYREAARLVSALDPAALFPTRNAFAALGACVALWAFAVTRTHPPTAPSGVRGFATTPITKAAINNVDVAITPPSYAGQRAQSVRDPARIEALVGSRVRLSIHAAAASIVVETLRGKLTLAPSSPNTFSVDLPADADGYVALEPETSAGRAGARRLIGLSVIADNPPRVRITAPGKDVFLRDTHNTIDLAVEASDDIGLASLRLRYTKVSGSGERFTFVEGDVPLTVARTDARTWTARAKWRLDELQLAPGDMVVYRAAAADHRPGAAPTESDSFIAEILAPGGNAASGFALNPNEERYAVSQQMVILKTERLLARKASMQGEAFATESLELAAEQRKVRAEFVFMMGGELADAPDPTASMTDLNEEAEAAGESDLAAGRMLNRGRAALLRAIRSMSRAAAGLTTADVAPALIHERAALAQLELAFSRTRIILRALTERERLDPTRRLTGVLTDASRDVRASAEPQADPRVVALRRALAGIATLVGSHAAGTTASAQASSLAESVLRVDPSSKALQDVAALLTSGQLDRAATSLAVALRAELSDAPAVTTSPEVSRLGGALADALRPHARTP
ncbi:MAG: putative rane protein [Gemmatimonadetes bacterium]|nr:putative rane protein [Gemmatimonadota bacterium]